MLRRIVCIAAALAALTCATAPELPAPHRSSVFGEVRLVPPEGITPVEPDAGGYASRRFRDTQLVDYSRPGYAVVYSDGPPAAGRVSFQVRSGRTRTRVEPDLGAVGVGGVVAVENASTEAHVVSLPSAGLVRRLAPGERFEVSLAEPGELQVFLLDAPGARARLFVAPGPYAVVSASGRYALNDLEPGPRELRVWHPRFPTASHQTELHADEVVRIDLAVGVHSMHDGETDAPR